MSDYVYANKMHRSGCPKCGGANKRNNKWRFTCEDCKFSFP